MRDLVIEARQVADNVGFDDEDAASLLRRLADALERSEGECERLRRERERLAVHLAAELKSDSPFAGSENRRLAIGSAIRAMGRDRPAITVDGAELAKGMAAALAAHDREMEGSNMGESTEFECACGNPPTHETYSMRDDIRHYFCCACWIKAGELPVEWCDGCYAARQAMQAKSQDEARP